MAKAEAVQGIESHAEALGCVLFEKGNEQKSTMKQYSWYHFVPILQHFAFVLKLLDSYC